MNAKENTPKTATESTSKVSDDRRLWIGNLDPRVTEYQLLKLMQQHGNIEKFDLLFHRTGPQSGQPRGYAFVTFSNKESALTAKNNLHNKLVGTKNIVVTWAHSMTTEEVEKPKPEINIPALSMSKSGTKLNRESQIQAIEAKLKLMQHKTSNELEINRTVAAEPPLITLYQNKKSDSNSTSSHNIRYKHNSKRCEKSAAPYSKKRTKR